MYSFFIILFIPKIDLINIPNFWQGIRFEDLLLLIYFTLIVLNFRQKIINNQDLQRFLPLMYYFIIIFIGSFVGKLSGSEIIYISLVRIIEYVFLIILLCNFQINKKETLIYLKFYVLLNLLFVILQKFGLIGSFTSLGYLGPDHPQSTRVMGLTGGSWNWVLLLHCVILL